jgi:iron complex transport system permease protein
MTAPDATRRTVDFGERTVVVRRRRAALRWRVRSVVVCAAILTATLAVSVTALFLGGYSVSPSQLWAVVTGDPDAGFASVVILEWRVPRALAAATFGAALGASGAVFQSLTRNPLASPDIIGFSAGSYTGALVVIIVIGGTYLEQAAGAIVGGLVTAAVVYAVAWRGGVQGFRLIVVGIAVAAMLGSFNTWLMLTADMEVAMSAASWGAGSLTGIGWSEAGIGSAVALTLLGILALLAPGLRQLELGDDAARSTGVRAEPIRLGAIVVGVALTAAVTAAAGPIAFISLAAPQIVRRLTRSPGIAVAPAALTGALLLAAADVIGQHLLPTPTPVGVVTVVGGGSYLVWLIVREVRRRT